MLKTGKTTGPWACPGSRGWKWQSKGEIWKRYSLGSVSEQNKMLRWEGEKQWDPNTAHCTRIHCVETLKKQSWGNRSPSKRVPTKIKRYRGPGWMAGFRTQDSRRKKPWNMRLNFIGVGRSEKAAEVQVAKHERHCHTRGLGSQAVVPGVTVLITEDSWF